MPTPPPTAPAALANGLDERVPWLGLDAFTASEKERFYGRKADLEELTQRIKREVGTVLYGQSGLGKTSLLQAGLAPRLIEEHYLPVLIRLIHKSDAPPLMEQVVTEVALTLKNGSLFEPVLPAPGEDFWRYLHRRDVPFLTTEGYDVTLVLLFDQFEEIFTNGQANPSQARRSKEFFAQLTELVQGRTPAAVKEELTANPEAAEKLKLREHDYHILVSLREDYLPHLDTAVERFIAPDLVRNRQRLLPFDGASALAAVEGPGEGLLEPGVAEKIVRKVAAARQRHLSVSFLGETDDAPLDLTDLRIEPALLSLLCSRLNAARLERQRQSLKPELITDSLLEGMGGRVLESFYQEALDALPKPAREAVASFIEEKLLSEGGQHRQQVVMDSAEKTLADGGLTIEAARHAIEILIKQRLLRIEDRGDVPRIELTHDVLCAIVGRFRDQRRAWRHRLQWWKNAAAVAAAVFFFAALYFAFDASQKRSEAMGQKTEAMKQKVEAVEQAGLARVAKVVAEQEKGKARDAETKALEETGRNYAKYVRQEAEKKNLGSSLVFFARGMEIGSMRRPDAFGYIAAQPLLTSARNFALDATTTRLAWAGTQRRVLGLTANKHLWVLDGDFQEPHWLQDNGGQLILAPLTVAGEKRDDHRVRVVAAIPWRSPEGAETILASVEGRGLVRILPNGATSPPQRILGGDPNTLCQDPVSGRTWVSLPSGIVLKLNAAAGQPDSSFTYFVPRRARETFLPEQPWPSSHGLWTYEPLLPDDDSSLVERTIPSRETGEDEGKVGEVAKPLWQLVNTKIKAPLFAFKKEFVRQRPSLVVFSAREQEVLLRFGNPKQAQLFKLPVTRPKSRTPTSPPKDGAEKTQGGKEEPPPPPLPAMALETSSDITAVAFVGGNDLIAVGEAAGTVNLFRVSDGTLALKIQLPHRDYGIIDRIVTTEDGRNLVVLQKNDAIGAVGFTIFRLESDAKTVSSRTVVSTTYREDPDIFFTGDGAQVLVQTVTAGKQSREWIRVSDGSSSREVPWESFAPGMQGAFIGAVALDAQRGLLAVSCSSGIGFVNAATGETDDFFLTWPNPQPHLLSSSASRNGFTTLAGPSHFWQLAYEPYPRNKARGLASVSITNARREGNMSDAVTAFTEHPSGRFAATGYRDGTIRFQRDTAEPDAEFFERVPAFSKGVATMAFSPDGQTFAAADEGGALTLWSVLNDPLPQVPLATRKGGENHLVVELHDGQFAFSDRAGLQLWNPTTGALAPIPLQTPCRRVLALGPGEKAIPSAVVEETETLLSWIDLSTRQRYATADLADSQIIRPHPAFTERITRLSSVVLSPDGHRCALLNHRGEVEFWTLPPPQSGPAELRKAQRSAFTLPERVTTVAFDATGRWALLVPQTGRPFILDLNQQSLARREIEADWGIRAATAIPGTEAFLLATDEGTLWMDCALERLSMNHRLSDTPADVICVSPDGTLALTAGTDGSAFLLDLQERRSLGPLAHSEATDFERGASFSSDSRRLLGMSAGLLRWWQPAHIPTSAEAQLMTGLTVNSELEIAPAVRHSENLRQVRIPSANPLLTEVWCAVRELSLQTAEDAPATLLLSYPMLRGALDAADGISALPESLRQQAKELPMLSSFDPIKLNSRQACLLTDQTTGWDSKARTRIFSSPPSSLANWAGEARGEWTWLAAAVRLADGTEKIEEPVVNATYELNPALLEPVETARRDCLQAVSEGFIPDQNALPAKLRSLLADFGSTSEHWSGLTDGDAIENRRQGLKFGKWAAEFRQSDANAWINLGVRMDNLALALGEKNNAGDSDSAAPTPTGQSSEADQLHLGSMACYQRAVLESEILDSEDSLDSRAYALANWDNNLIRMPETKFTPEELKKQRNLALELAREATRAAPKVNYAWRRLAEVAENTEEILKATEQRVATAKDGPAGELKDARQQLGRRYREQGFIDKAIDNFEKLVAEDSGDVYSLVEMGELLRIGGYPLEECLVPFQAAVEADQKKELSAQDNWGRTSLGQTYEQWGRSAEAEATYRQSLAIVRAGDSKAVGPIINLAAVLLRLGRWDEAGSYVEELKKGEYWLSVAGLGSRGLSLAKLEEQKSTALSWLNAVIDSSAANPANLWDARSTALAALGRQPEALELIATHVKETPETDRTSDFWMGIHLKKAECLAENQSAAALQELALATTQGWQDSFNLWSNERLDRALKNIPAYVRLRAALFQPFDGPERFVELARFQLSAAAAFETSGETPLAASCTQTATRFLADAVRRGWNPGDAELGQPPFDLATKLPGWAAEFGQARQDAADELRAEAIAIAKALDTARDERAWKHAEAPAKQWPQIAAKLVGRAGLKRREGRDFYGQPYTWDAHTGKVSLSQQTQKLVAQWIDQPNDYWTVDANSVE